MKKNSRRNKPNTPQKHKEKFMLPKGVRFRIIQKKHKKSTWVAEETENPEKGKWRKMSYAKLCYCAQELLRQRTILNGQLTDEKEFYRKQNRRLGKVNLILLGTLVLHYVFYFLLG